MPKKPGHPDGWARRAIGDVAAVSFSSVDKKSVVGEVPVRLCNYMDVWKNHYIDADLPFMEATATPREIKQFTLVKHDVLLTKDSETKEDIADPAVVRTDRDDLVLGYHLALVRPDPKKAHGPFIAAQLALPQFRAQFVRVANGATRYGLGIDEVRNGTLLLPGVEEQKMIAEYLGAVDAAIDATRGVIEQTRRLKTAVLQDLLTRGLPGRHSEFREVKGLGHVPRAWKPTRLKRVTTRITDGVHASVKTVDDGVPFLYVSCVRDGRVLWDDAARITQKTYAEISRGREPVAGGVLYTAVGSYGHAAVLDDDRAFSFQRHIAYLVPDPSKLDPHFLALWLNSERGRRQADRVALGNAQKTITLGELNAWEIPLPKLDEQQDLVAVVRSIDGRIAADTSHLLRLGRAKTALNQALLTGRVRVPTAKGVPVAS